MRNIENSTILVVDDNALILKSYETILKNAGYRVLTASTGMAALQIIGEYAISLVLLDVILPDLSGLEVLKRIKSNTNTEQLFVVLISSMATSSENQIEGMEMGADGYLVKPMPSWELVLRISGFLKHKQTIDQLRVSEERYRIISEKTREALQASNTYLRAIMENSSTIFVALDKDCRIRFANRQAIEMASKILNKSLVVGNSIIDLIKPERQEIFRQNFNSVMSGYPLYIERSVTNEDGTVTWYGIQYSRSADYSDKTLGVVLILNDITEKKSSEELLYQYQYELERKVEERTVALTELNKGLKREIQDRKRAEMELKKLSNVVEQAADIVMITDKFGKIEYVNPAFVLSTGYTREEAIGKTPAILNSQLNDADYIRNLWETILSKKPFNGVSVNKKKSGEIFYEAIKVTPLLDSEGQITHFVSVGTDITELRKAESDRIARQAADEANKAKSLFLANMSHEIRTPMNAIIGFSELLYNSIKDPKQRSQIDSIRNSGKNLLRIINDILDLSKIEAGKLAIVNEPCNIRQLVAETETIFSHLTDQKGIDMITDIESSLPAFLLIDETRVRQILFNLIGNAVKFTDNGSVTLTVRSKPKSQDFIDLLIEVKDTGIGIREDQQDTIFEAFSQQDGQQSAKYGGTGLGLTITKRLIEMMNGSIRLQSEYGQGSNFSILLPDVQVCEQEDIESGEEENPNAVLFKPATILIADDHPENRKFLVDLFLPQPIRILEAENGNQVLDLVKENQPDLILLDYKMPGMDGNEVVEKLKRSRMTRSIPLVALSASSREILEDQYGKIKIDDFLLKPLMAKDLYRILMKYLDYSITEPDQSDEPTKEDESFVFTDEQKRRLPAIVEELERQFMPTFEDVAKKQVVGPIKAFAVDLKKFGEDHDFKSITQYGDELMTRVATFDINQMMKKLGQFPQIINQLKKISEE